MERLVEDDPDVLLRNTQLAGPDIVGWAFTTDLIGHYQPFSWLIWSALKSVGLKTLSLSSP